MCLSIKLVIILTFQNNLNSSTYTSTKW